MDSFLKMVKNFQEFYAKMDSDKKTGTFVVFALILVGFVAIFLWAARTRFEVLYTDLNKEDSKKVAILLEENNISYQLEDGGTTIMIPQDMVNAWRLRLATLGVSFSGTVGYEVFDKQSFGTTTFVQKVNRQRALEGELIKTIGYIEGVRRARVHLNIPENSPFVSEKKPPSASVVLDLQRGVQLSESEIRGVALLISSAVEGMSPESVVVLNEKGKQLSENVGDPMTVVTANRLALESKLNRKYERQVEEILGKVVGEDRVVAKVAVTMDFTESVSTSTTFDSENAATLSEVVNSQKLLGVRPSPQGVPGARSNLPGELPLPGAPETRNDVDKNLVTRNYNVPSTVTRSEGRVASVESVSVAVMIDGKRVPVLDEDGEPETGDDGKPRTRYEEWSEADLENFSAIVASTIGIDPGRGDKLVIKNMEFASVDLAAAEDLMRQKANRELIGNVVKYLAVGFTISLFFFLIVKPFVQWVTDNTVETVEDFLPKTLEELEKIQVNQKLPGLEDALPQLEEKLNPEKIEGNMLREKVISLVGENPSKAAQIVQEMIHSRETDKSIA